ncbi:hypothetical protein [Methylobacterium sp. 17Sr1-1]|uniref:hypothetical protein n=1 Tax=Methylobacterium sp. 17Sr1-1 TaxID=2202826 RepID=UPI000D6F5154|nr:hypothetical protein [Methylobacterium sp. 17Sr1-1]AWN55070.1 hypothetical protein DK412_28475 [Methylobacterium sp. 17Sr1-1]
MADADGIRMNNLPSGNLDQVFGLSPSGTVSRQDISLFIQFLLQQSGADPAGLPAEILRAKAAERLARTLASPKLVLANDPYRELASGAVDDGGGGVRVPAGQSGAGSQLRARFNLSASDIAANAGRLVRFVSVYRVTPGFLTAFKDSAGNSTLFNVADGVTGGTATATAIQADTVMVEMDAVLTGNELLPAQIFLIGGGTQPVSADVSIRLLYTAWFPADATGTTDVLAKVVQPFPSAIGELIALATARYDYSGAAGVTPAFGGRGFIIPAGRTGAGALLIVGVPAQGLAAGVVVRARFLFGTSLDLEPATRIVAFGATVDIAGAAAVGASGASLTKLGTGVYEGRFTYTLVGGETRFEFYLVTSGPDSTTRTTRAFVRLEQATLEIVSTPLTTTINGQVASYRAQSTARLAQTPGRRREVTVAVDGSSLDGLTKIIDGTALMSAAGAVGPDEANVVRIMPGTYLGECAPGAAVETSPAISPAAFVHLVGQGRASDIQIISRFADNQANQETAQPLRITQSGYYANFTVIGRNLRYPLHIEAGNAPNRAVQVFDSITAIHEGATGFVSSSGFGIGNHPGNRQLFRDCRGRSPTGAFGAHDNINWGEPCYIDIEGGAYHGTGIDGRSITLTSTGSGVLSPVTVRGAALAGHVRMDCSYLAGALLANHRANRYGYSLTVYASSPIDAVGVCDVSALTLTSVAGASSAVAVSGPGAAVLFGAAPDVREGAADYAARVYSYHAVDVPAGEVDPGVTLAARLGNRSGSPLSLGVAWDGQQPVTVTLSADYRGMSNAAIVSALNSALATAMGGNAGGRAFSLSQPYNNRPPVHQPDREGRGLNVGTTTILHGMALAWSGHDVRAMTSTDATSLFAGFAIGDAVPGRPARFLRTGWIGQAQLRFDGTPSIQPGDRFQVSASVPGALVEGTDLPLLVVRSVEPHGACLEIIESVLFTGDTQQAVRDAFASVTINDIPSVADAINGKAATAYVDGKVADVLQRTQFPAVSQTLVYRELPAGLTPATPGVRASMAQRVANDMILQAWFDQRRAQGKSAWLWGRGLSFDVLNGFGCNNEANDKADGFVLHLEDIELVVDTTAPIYGKGIVRLHGNNVKMIWHGTCKISRPYQPVVIDGDLEAQRSANGHLFAVTIGGLGKYDPGGGPTLADNYTSGAHLICEGTLLISDVACAVAAVYVSADLKVVGDIRCERWLDTAFEPFYCGTMGVWDGISARYGGDDAFFAYHPRYTDRANNKLSPWVAAGRKPSGGILKNFNFSMTRGKGYGIGGHGDLVIRDGVTQDCWAGDNVVYGSGANPAIWADNSGVIDEVNVTKVNPGNVVFPNAVPAQYRSPNNGVEGAGYNINEDQAANPAGANIGRVTLKNTRIVNPARWAVAFAVAKGVTGNVIVQPGSTITQYKDGAVTYIPRTAPQDAAGYVKNGQQVDLDILAKRGANGETFASLYLVEGPQSVDLRLVGSGPVSGQKIAYTSDFQKAELACGERSAVMPVGFDGMFFPPAVNPVSPPGPYPSQVLPANYIFFRHFPEAGTASAVWLKVITAVASGKIRAGIYDVGPRGGVGKLIVEGSIIDASTTGSKSSSLPYNVVLDRGCYIAVLASNPIEVRSGVPGNVRGNGFYQGGFDDNPRFNCIRSPQAFGPLPASPPSAFEFFGGDGSLALIGLNLLG